MTESTLTRTPERLVYEWTEDGRFVPLGDPNGAAFEQNWSQVLKILQGRTVAATHAELLMDWPADQERPSATVLYEWLNRAYAEKRVRREGQGTKPSPWRYRLENEDDAYHDRGELPPIRELPWLPDIPAPRPRNRKTKGGAAAETGAEADGKG